MSDIRRVLLVYTDPYYLVKQVYPYGLDVLADRLRGEGAEVRIEYAFLPGPDPAANLASAAREFEPDLVGLGVRNIDTCMACEEFGDFSGKGFRSFFFLPQVRAACEAIRELSPGVPMILGGGGFSVAPEAMLDYLDAEFGVVGEGEEALAEFIRAWPDREALHSIPGLAVRGPDGRVAVRPRRPFAFPGRASPSRDPGFRHAFESAGLPVRVKRGCNQACVFCVEPLIEGRRFVYRDIADVVAELEAAADMPHVNKVFFVDTEFNVPDEKHASELVRALIDQNLHSRFRFTSQFLPRPFDRDFAALLAEAGFSVILTCTCFADEVLEASGASYRESDITGALELCAEYEIDATVDLIFGLPGETWETVAHTLSRMNEFPPAPFRRYEYTVGGRVYPGTSLADKVVKDGRENLYGADGAGLEPVFYCSPASPLELKAHVDARAPAPMRFDNEPSEASRSLLAVGYLADRGRFAEAYDAWLSLDLPGRSRTFDYFFRSMADAGHAEAARTAAIQLKRAIAASRDETYQARLGVIDYYLELLERAGV
jgi:hypothetical protein